MYKLIVRRMVRTAFESLNRGDFERPLGKFAPDVHFRFAGDNAMGADVHGVEGARSWFRRAFGLFEGIRFEIHDVVVAGWPWNTTVATHFTVTATLPEGRPYRNEGMQLVRLRWGRIVEDLIFEDTHVVGAALEYLAEHGVREAGLGAIGAGGARGAA